MKGGLHLKQKKDQQLDEILGQLSFEFPAVKNSSLLSVAEIYHAATQSLLENLKEDRRIERKPAGVHPSTLGDYFSMWANTKPDGGIIVIGQENDGTLSGCMKYGQNRINELERTGNIYCPDARYEIRRVNVRLQSGKDDFVMLFRIFYRENKLVRTVREVAFVRSADSKKKLTEEEARELEIEKRQVDFEQEPSGLEYPKDFNTDLIEQFTLACNESRGLDTKHPAEDILQLNHLGKIESGKFVPNNACTLLFSHDPRSRFPGCKIRFLRFDGETEGTGEKFNAIKDILVDEGSVPVQIIAFEKVMDGQIREFSRLGKDGIFYTAPEYPKLAWYEAIVNAYVHRSYSQRSMNIFVKMFDDRLVIESPGGFPPLVTSENIYDMHVPRNPYLMEAMYYMKFVKCAHEGTRRIRDTMTSLGLPKPEFEHKEINYALVRVTLRNNIAVRKVYVDKDVSSIIGAAIAQTLNENERRVINFLAENKKISVSQVQRITGKSWPASSKLLRGLKQMGILNDVRKSRKRTRDPSARYVLRSGDKSNESSKA
jgi:ATP-dependent DNA helicase RecG